MSLGAVAGGQSLVLETPVGGPSGEERARRRLADEVSCEPVMGVFRTSFPDTLPVSGGRQRRGAPQQDWEGRSRGVSRLNRRETHELLEETERRTPYVGELAVGAWCPNPMRAPRFPCDRTRH